MCSSDLDLTGMDLANASMLDEGTAAAEAMALCHRLNPKAGDVFFVDADALPQTIAVVETRAEPLGIDVVVGDPATDIPDAGVFGVLLQYPGASGQVRDDAALIAGLRGRGVRVAVAADRLGYESEASFSRAFKRVIGHAPSAARSS